MAFDAVDPQDGKIVKVYVTYDRAKWLARKGKGALLEIQHTVRAVLKSPRHIYEGIRLEKDEPRLGDGADSWRCYCGWTDAYYAPNEERPQPSRKDDVFLVFVNEDLVAYNWGWEAADEIGDCLPDGHAERFLRKVL